MNPLQNSAQDGVAVTPSDTLVFNPPLTALWVGGAGALTVVTAQGSSLLFSAVAAGVLIPLQVAKVMATGTVATAIVGLK